MPIPTIADENLNAGTSAWQIKNNAGNHEIEGYASATSVLRGDCIAFHVSTTASTFRIDFYRMGWYQGLGARLMMATDALPGAVQPAPTEDERRMIECAWSPSYTLNVPAEWCPGVYLAKLITLPGSGQPGFQQYVVFVVRDDERRPLLFQTSVTTYQAYNPWGGKSLYGDTSIADEDASFANRSLAVSFDRPYADYSGASQFLAWEAKLIRWLEREGYDVSYATNIDVHRDPALVSTYSVFLSVGHDEYWSSEMRAHVEDALRRGTSLAFLGANAIYWQVRFEPSSLGENRRMLCYKGEKDLWRDLGMAEQALIGVMYDGWFRSDQTPSSFPLVPVNTHLWPYRNTGLSEREPIPRLVGYEYDRIFDNYPSPPRIEKLAESSVVDSEGRKRLSHATLYTAESGDMVFAAGTNNWANGLIDEDAHPGIQRLTRNILDRFMTLTRGGRVLIADFSSGPPVRDVYLENHAAYAELDGWHDPEDLKLVGNFMGREHDQVLFINRNRARVGGRALIADFSYGPPVRGLYWENWGQHAQLDGWHDPDDLSLAGDFMGIGHDQVMFINRDPARAGGRVLIADFSKGPPVRGLYWENWGQHAQLDGWHDRDDLALVGDFMGLGHDQAMFINRDPARAGGRVLIADFSKGPPVRGLYWENWGQHARLDGWHDREDLALVGDFMGIGRDQVMFINRDPARAGGRVLIADFSKGPPARRLYWENWGQHAELDGWHDREDLALVGDFMGVGRDQVMFINRDRARAGGRVLIADFAKGPPVRGLYWENWGQHAELDGWHDADDLQLVGDFRGGGKQQVLFINMR